MIIVSQTDEVVNFRNVLVITIVRDGNRYYLKAHYSSGTYTRIGSYKTLERAKEVLQDIADRYEFLKCAEAGICQLDIADQNYKYEMPEN